MSDETTVERLHERVLKRLGWTREGAVWVHPGVVVEGNPLEECPEVVIVQMLEYLLERGDLYIAQDDGEHTVQFEQRDDMCFIATTLADALAQAVDTVEDPE